MPAILDPFAGDWAYGRAIGATRVSNPLDRGGYAPDGSPRPAEYVIDNAGKLTSHVKTGVQSSNIEDRRGESEVLSFLRLLTTPQSWPGSGANNQTRFSEVTTMPQQLKVYQDPSIVQNVPTTPMEQLQLAVEREAERRRQTLAVDPFTGRPISAAGNAGASRTASALSAIDSAAPREVQAPWTDPRGLGAGYVDKPDQSRLVGGADLSAGVMEAAPAAGPTGSAFTMGWGSPFMRKNFLSGDPGEVTVGNQGMGGVRGPVDQGQYGPTPTVRSVIAARNARPSGFNDVPRRPSPAVHAALMAQQSADQRGQAALRASGMLDQFGMIT